MIKKLTCITCPMGCDIEIEMDEGEILSIKGNSCPRGEKYARSEMLHPERMVTSTVKTDGKKKRLPVITSKAVPKEEIFNVMKEINSAKVCLPVQSGDIIIKNVCGTGADILAERSQKA